MRYIEDAMRTDARWTCRSTLLYVRFLHKAVKLETQSIYKPRAIDAVAPDRWKCPKTSLLASTGQVRQHRQRYQGDALQSG